MFYEGETIVSKKNVNIKQAIVCILVVFMGISGINFNLLGQEVLVNQEIVLKNDHETNVNQCNDEDKLQIQKQKEISDVSGQEHVIDIQKQEVIGDIPKEDNEIETSKQEGIGDISKEDNGREISKQEEIDDISKEDNGTEILKQQEDISDVPKEGEETDAPKQEDILSHEEEDKKFVVDIGEKNQLPEQNEPINDLKRVEIAEFIQLGLEYQHIELTVNDSIESLETKFPTYLEAYIAGTPEVCQIQVNWRCKEYIEENNHGYYTYYPTWDEATYLINETTEIPCIQVL